MTSIRIGILALTLCGLVNVTGCTKTYQASDASTEAKKTETSASETTEQATPNATPASEAGGIKVVQAVACRSVENRAPVGESTTFTPDVGRIYLFTNTHLSDAAETSIHHEWNYNGKEMAKVKLPIRGPRWRTYSSKAIDPSWKGDWNVKITTATGELIQTVSFKVE